MSFHSRSDGRRISACQTVCTPSSMFSGLLCITLSKENPRMRRKGAKLRFYFITLFCDHPHRMITMMIAYHIYQVMHCHLSKVVLTSYLRKHILGLSDHRAWLSDLARRVSRECGCMYDTSDRLPCQFEIGQPWVIPNTFPDFDRTGHLKPIFFMPSLYLQSSPVRTWNRLAFRKGTRQQKKRTLCSPAGPLPERPR